MDEISKNVQCKCTPIKKIVNNCFVFVIQLTHLGLR